jgi:CRISPR/Cas system endoribonuclease Cas6 (RAMP superfamily)
MKKISFNADVNVGNPYEAHRLVSAMFPKQKANYVNIDGQFEVYAENEPIIDEFAKRFNVNVDWVEDVAVESGKTYSITCKAAAKIKVKGGEYKEGGNGRFPVSYKSVSAKISNPKFFYITDAKEMKEWVRHNLAKNGCEIKLYDEKAQESDFILEIDNEYATHARIPEKNETVLYHSFNALVKITDTVKFENLLRNGLGEGRFLGFGMVRI